MTKKENEKIKVKKFIKKSWLGQELKMPVISLTGKLWKSNGSKT